MVNHIVTGLVARICAGLPPACASLNDEAAAGMLTRLNATHTALVILAAEDSTFVPPERQQMGELAKRGSSTLSAGAPVDEDIEEARANRLLPTFAALLGNNPNANP
jgi:hypothetical protein